MRPSPYLKKIQLLFFLLTLSSAALAQNAPPVNTFWERVRFGGGVGVGFNNAGFNGSLAPSAIYQVSDKFATGIGLSIIYSKVNDSKLTAYGGSIINLYNPVDFLQLSAELEQLRVNQSLGDLNDNFWSPALFLGVGYTNRFTTVGIRYNVLFNNDDSIYLNAWAPFIRFYF